jgi:hypothetical protein
MKPRFYLIKGTINYHADRNLYYINKASLFLCFSSNHVSKTRYANGRRGHRERAGIYIYRIRFLLIRSQFTIHNVLLIWCYIIYTVGKHSVNKQINRQVLSLPAVLFSWLRINAILYILILTSLVSWYAHFLESCLLLAKGRKCMPKSRANISQKIP